MPVFTFSSSGCLNHMFSEITLRHCIEFQNSMPRSPKRSVCGVQASCMASAHVYGVTAPCIFSIITLKNCIDVQFSLLRFPSPLLFLLPPCPVCCACVRVCAFVGLQLCNCSDRNLSFCWLCAVFTSSMLSFLEDMFSEVTLRNSIGFQICLCFVLLLLL